MSLVPTFAGLALLSVGLGIGLSFIVHYRFGVNHPPPTPTLPSFFIPAVTSHGRHLPLTAKNTFSFSVLYVGVDIDTLESGQLNLPFRVFAYSGHPATKILGLRSNKYLGKGEGREGFRARLNKFLITSGSRIRPEDIGKVWLVTSPSFVGYEGPNPLSTWYCYGKAQDGGEGSELVCVILEVHSTFGEAHAYILKVDCPLRHEPATGYDLAFTFPRSFHVSPFNSRDGYYRVDLVDPFPTNRKQYDLPQVKILLRLLTPERTHKLTAVLTSGPSPPIPLEAQAIPAILSTLAKWPFTLFSVTVRTLHQASILHYKKKLAVFPRPEPKITAAGQEGVFNPPEKDEERTGVVLQRQDEAWAEKKAREIVERWGRARAERTGTALEVKFGNGRESLRFAPERVTSAGNGHPLDDSDETGDALRITTSDPNFFTNLLLSPSAEHALILFPERLTSVNSKTLYLAFFAPPSSSNSDLPTRQSASIRTRSFLHLYSYSTLAPTPDIPSITAIPAIPHFADDTSILCWKDRLQITRVLFWAWFGEMADEGLLSLLRGRFVPGQEPWSVWDRGLKRVWGIDPKVPTQAGSVSLDT
ncbi:hypothetical protein IAR55_000672 [Kwoniella newhampshirensis]|uniref:DUF1365-domain-containing protein n=1 Tax=Kwoniella newhampshirensis TaxID=1651941 RepID=A0AAW0Z789_9TREE